MENETLNDWVEKSPMECPHGCGETLELVRRDHLFTGPDGKRVLGENVELLECSTCGEIFVPSRTSKMITKYFQGEIEASGMSQIPTLRAKTA